MLTSIVEKSLNRKHLEGEEVASGQNDARWTTIDAVDRKERMLMS